MDHPAQKPTGILIPIFLAQMAELRRELPSRSTAIDELRNRLIGLAFLVVYDSVTDAARAVIRGEAARLGIRFNRRSTLAHLAVDIAFATAGLAPSLRTLYAQAILGALAAGLNSRQFNEYVHTGPTGRGGLCGLAASFKMSKQTQGEPGLSGLASKVCTHRSIRINENFLKQLWPHFQKIPLTFGDGFTITIKITADSALEATNVLAAYRAA